jgi:hypothetical protein
MLRNVIVDYETTEIVKILTLTLHKNLPILQISLLPISMAVQIAGSCPLTHIKEG